MTTRNANRADIALQVGGGAYVPLNVAAGRDNLLTAFEKDKASRALPGGAPVVLALDHRTGAVSCVVLRTVPTDQLLCDAHHRHGNLRLRKQGTGNGRPQRIVPVFISTSLAIVAADVCLWTLTVAKSGAIDDTAQ